VYVFVRFVRFSQGRMPGADGCELNLAPVRLGG